MSSTRLRVLLGTNECARRRASMPWRGLTCAGDACRNSWQLLEENPSDHGLPTRSWLSLKDWIEENAPIIINWDRFACYVGLVALPRRKRACVTRGARARGGKGILPHRGEQRHQDQQCDAGHLVSREDKTRTIRQGRRDCRAARIRRGGRPVRGGQIARRDRRYRPCQESRARCRRAQASLGAPA